MATSFDITVLMTIAIISGITAQVLADYLKIPGIVFLLLFGILVGQDGLQWVQPQLLGNGLEVIVSMSVALILFEGGLSLELRELGMVSGSIRNLVTFGTLITLIGGGMAAHWLSEFPWSIAFLYASIIVVTGPTVVGPLLKKISVERQVATLLEGEGVLIDPIGAILAVLVLNIVLNNNPNLLPVFSGLMLRLAIGSAIGICGGWLLALILKKAQFLSDELKNLVVLAGLWAGFVLSEKISSESGLMAAVLAGIVLRASEVPEERLLRRFKGQLTILAISVLFILLAADLSLASLVALGWGSVLTVMVLILVVRPLNIWLCTWNSGLNWRQKLFMSWVAPRGIVSASVASLFSILLTQRGINGGDAIKALVFLTIMMTVFIQGLTAGGLAQLLKITSKSVTGVAIAGSNPLSRLIAQFFQERGEFVVLLDTEPDACLEAEKAGLTAYLSSGYDHDILEAIGLSSLGTFLAITNNSDVNLGIAKSAAEEFQPPRVLAIFPTENNENNGKIKSAFISDFSLINWNNFINQSEVKLGETVLKIDNFDFQVAHLQALMRTGELVPLLLERQGNLQVVAVGESWQIGDRIIYLLHDPRPELLKRLSGSHQPKLTLEKHPVVEVLPMYSNSQGASDNDNDNGMQKL